MAQKKRTRQRLRMGLILASLLLFPLTFMFFSPALIIEGASQGIINGSFIFFGLLLVGSLLLARAWCGWACPGAGLGEALFAVNDRRAAGGRWDWIKWGIWIPWIGAIAFVAFTSGGYHTVAPFWSAEIVPEPGAPPAYFIFRWVIYFFIVALIAVPALAAGRRGFCHTICWMAPFMIIGTRIRTLVRWPALHLRAQADKCIHCHACTRDCPMSLEVEALVERGDMTHDECILCGTCADTCPKDVIRYSFRGGKP